MWMRLIRWPLLLLCRYLQLRYAVIVIQAYARGMAGRKRYRSLLREKSSLIIQTAWRSYRELKKYTRFRSACLSLQCHFRRQQAQKVLKVLRQEARSVAGIQQKNRVLQQTVNELRTQLKETAEQSAALKEVQDTAEVLRGQLQETQSANSKLADDVESRPDPQVISDLEATNQRLRDELEQLKAALPRDAGSSAPFDTSSSATSGTPDSASKDNTQIAKVQKQLQTMQRERDNLDSSLKQTVLQRDEARLALASTESSASGSGESSEGSTLVAKLSTLETANHALTREVAEKMETIARLMATGGSGAVNEGHVAVEGGSDSVLAAIEGDVSAAEGTVDNPAPLESAASDVYNAELQAELDRMAAEKESLQQILQQSQTNISALEADLKDFYVAGSTNDGSNPESGTSNVITSDTPASADPKGDLLSAKTNIARLQLANTKLLNRVTEMEKEQVRKDRGIIDDEAQAQIDTLNNALEDAMAEKTAVDETARSLVEQSTVAKAEAEDWKRRFEQQANESGTEDATQARLKLEDDKKGLQAEVARNVLELDAAKSALQDATVSIGHLEADNKTVRGRVVKLEALAAQKITADNSSASKENRLQEEIGILINELLEQREKVRKAILFGVAAYDDSEIVSLVVSHPAPCSHHSLAH